MYLSDYITKKGLSVQLVAQACGTSRQNIYKIGRKCSPTYNTLKKIADAMTEMGVPTTVVELYAAMSGEKE